jgi:hypothetical protein
MSEENIEITRRLIEAFTGEPEAAGKIFDLMDPGIAVHDFPGVPDAEWHHGHQGVVECGLKMWATGKISGARTSQAIYVVLTFRNGLLLHLVGYTSKAQALKAAGLSE